ncbi:MAG: RsmE family RNA methyltransferase [Spirochaetaceae bacterium]|nr:MAG: RsmE family RNA methyltransferase [Spirochaetaceae bacterium]
MNRMLFEAEELQGVRVALGPRDRRALHLRGVLRSSVGDSVRAGIVNGPSGVFRVLAMAHDGVTGEFTACESAAEATGHSAGIGGTLLLGAVRPIVFKRLVKDLSTLGLARIMVCAADLTERSYLSASIWERGVLRDRLVAGAEQGGHTRLPELAVYRSLTDALAEVSDSFRIVADQDGVPPATILSHREAASADWTAAVGPERGFSDRERSALIAAGFMPVSLGPSILRSEVAAQVLPLMIHAFRKQ